MGASSPVSGAFGRARGWRIPSGAFFDVASSAGIRAVDAGVRDLAASSLAFEAVPAGTDRGAVSWPVTEATGGPAIGRSGPRRGEAGREEAEVGAGGVLTAKGAGGTSAPAAGLAEACATSEPAAGGEEAALFPSVPSVRIPTPPRSKARPTPAASPSGLERLFVRRGGVADSPVTADKVVTFLGPSSVGASPGSEEWTDDSAATSPELESSTSGRPRESAITSSRAGRDAYSSSIDWWRSFASLASARMIVRSKYLGTAGFFLRGGTTFWVSRKNSMSAAPCAMKGGAPQTISYAMVPRA